MTTIRKVLLSILTCLVLILIGKIYFFLNSVLLTIFRPPQHVPKFPYHNEDLWLNSPSIRLNEQLGKVVILFVWTFD